MDLSLTKLRAAVRRRDADRRVYPYVVRTVKIGQDGHFCQAGCSPNFQGGWVTLGACKHHMRSSSYVAQDDGAWIAGVTSGGVTPQRRRYLFYLMFATPVRSHAEMWSRLPAATRNAKSARLHSLGDLYQPRRAGLDGDQRFKSKNYFPPAESHGHKRSGTWPNDIDSRYGAHRAVLLLGKPERSFLWSHPQIWLREDESTRLPRNPAGSDDIAAFLRRLDSQPSSR